jgi:hypothetical protein
MNTTQHAPAPWTIKRISRWHDGTPQEFDLLEVVSREGYQLAITHNCKPKAVATANLISAAPDMLDALQAVCDAYGDRDTLLMAQVKAALAKAKGGAK